MVDATSASIGPTGTLSFPFVSALSASVRSRASVWFAFLKSLAF